MLFHSSANSAALKLCPLPITANKTANEIMMWMLNNKLFVHSHCINNLYQVSCNVNKLL